jgi:hypothetical protein
MRQANWILAMSGLAVAAFATPARAQSSPVAATRTVWEVEGYGGFSDRSVATGAAALPAAGAPITTSNPTFPSRQTPSWFFGDGSALLNGALGDLGLPNRITPLDSALGSLGFNARGPAGGLRVRRSITPRLSAELSVDVLGESLGLTNAMSGAVESSRASFVTTFQGLFASGPFSGAAVTATAATANGSGREVATTGSIRLHCAPRFGLVPYFTFGAGVLARTGTLPSATLTGNYQALAVGSVPINETDRVVVRFSQGAGVVAVLGAGLRRAVSARWGIEADGRVLVGPDPAHALLDASPSVASGTPAGFIESFTYPSIQFSNSPSTGRSSSLGGPALQGFSALSGGVQAHVLVTLGVYVRF